MDRIHGVNFYDLTQITEQCSDVVVDNPTMCISATRIKAILYNDKHDLFFFNGHFEYSNSGASDNPKIGTT